MIGSETHERRQRLLVAVAASVGSPGVRLCAAAGELLAMTGAGVSLTSDGAQRTAMGATGDAQQSEELQATLGEGPSFDVQRRGRAVLVADLAADDRWPAFGPAAQAAGIGAVFAFPLGTGAVRIGALVLYRSTPGELDDGHFVDALVLADIGLHMMLSVQAQAPSDELHRLLSDDTATNWEVHQATGMVATQLAIAIDRASVRLRAYAFGADRPLAAVAADVVARRLRLDDWGS